MKYLLYSSFLLLIAFVIGGCQGESEMISPNDDLLKEPIVLVWGDPDPISGNCVELVAGQHNVVGEVCVEKVGDGLKITYTLSGEDCKITEVHVDLASELSNDPVTGFHANDNGNPQFGHFDKAFEFGVGTSDPVEVYFNYDELKAALGVTTITAGTKIYIAAHSGVCCPEEGTGDPILCPDLPDGSTSTVGIFNQNSLNASFIWATFNFNSSNEFYEGWCILPDQQIQRSGQLVDFLCTYDGSFLCNEGGIIEKPENMDLVNWLINNRGSYANATNNDVQWAIWILLLNDINPLGNYQPTDPILVDQMVADAYANGEGYVPGCDDKVGVIVYQSGSDWCNYPSDFPQVYFIEVPVECIPQYGCETAMGFNYPVDNTSSLFPGHVWFRYFGYTY
jgi:hypothetical protein